MGCDKGPAHVGTLKGMAVSLSPFLLFVCSWAGFGGSMWVGPGQWGLPSQWQNFRVTSVHHLHPGWVGRQCKGRSGGVPTIHLLACAPGEHSRLGPQHFLPWGIREPGREAVDQVGGQGGPARQLRLSCSRRPPLPPHPAPFDSNKRRDAITERSCLADPRPLPRCGGREGDCCAAPWPGGRGHCGH